MERTLASRLQVSVRGIVQGVGFRPFIFNLASRLRLSGWILNNKLGVKMEIQGDPGACGAFLRFLREEAPPLAIISEVEANEVEPLAGETGFQILHSDAGGDDVTLISPDNDVCKDCLGEMFSPDDRRYRYPFINCTNCGPRYTLIRGTPYDREFTSMRDFIMCEECRGEYQDPSHRRFHAQPNACPECGPSLSLLDADGRVEDMADPVRHVMEMIKDGGIVAIKGLGGYHIACDASNEATVRELRRRKVRKEKPFAVMSRSVDDIRKYAHVSEVAEKLLLSREKPIVLLGKNGAGFLAESIAPGMGEYGVFLPYTPLHHLLFLEDAPLALVMTSGNLSDEPIVFDESELLDRLGGIVDAFLVNNRPIVWRCDDSVVRVFSDKKPVIVRRSRGWVPAPIFVEDKLPSILACGGDLKNVFCLARGNTVFPGPHIGDLENVAAFDSFKASIAHFKGIFGIEPELVAVDMHPAYYSSGYGRSLGLPLVEVQHHHAHIVSVMAEHRLKGDVIGLALDGTGFGDDGTIWGGEVLLCDSDDYERKAHFPYLKLPGGDRAAREPWRTAVACLYGILGENFYDGAAELVRAVGMEKVRGVIEMVEADVNCPLSCGAGRLFDAAASTLLIRHENTFEGQAPMMMEAAADASVDETFPFALSPEGVFDFGEMFLHLLALGSSESGRSKGAAMFHNTVATALAESCRRVRGETGVSSVCLSGGVFQNIFLLNRIVPALEKDGFTVHMPRQLPANDGGLALGQLVIASRRSAGR